MKFEKFNQLIDKLSEQEEYEKVDEILDNQIDEIIKLDSKEIEKYLMLYASLAGDAESLARFHKLFNKAVFLGKIKQNDLKKYEELSPANRWL
ncbi:hypothetical protein ACT4YX_12280 [Acinetobacter baumannii]|uniref:hypothetical protein n=1 Tax=Acinetobacter baumannii TaxID=470 RepID=UPI0029407697|nr:hypothetical protein [Acinetobacter baumannii]EKU0940634.1 hypothetical protein [Acinetobacter baumannii]EKX7142485.1 hypothetical protein [Acinetobacter baumannii]MCZ2946899.1 hypothetical protein [Acinetobacter baumannii]MCZ3332324.1 hypothetical protein [Acinetobacter baumannii]MDV4301923.1 hypothetical protein [Acinetobacter baumannii]